MVSTLHDRRPDPMDADCRVVRCPACGQLEFWTEAETRDHGLCRTRGGPCPGCAPTSPPLLTDRKDPA